MNASGQPSHLLAYSHTQRAPLCLLIYFIAAGELVVAWLIRETAPQASVAVSVIACVIAVLATTFHHLKIADRGDRLAIGFGPLPILRRSVRYADLVSVAVSRTTFLDGWGIHYSLRGGWVWNLWGRDCVEIKLRNGTLWLGTNDAANLAVFLAGKLANKPSKV